MDIKALGQQLIDEGIASQEDFLPIKKWSDKFPLYFTTEFLICDFEREVGFWGGITGLSFLSLSDAYAILKHPENTWTFSIKKASENYHYHGVKVQIYTDDLKASIEHLERRDYPFTIERVSDIQRFVSLKSPSGIEIEIWSGMEK